MMSSVAAYGQRNNDSFTSSSPLWRVVADMIAIINLLVQQCFAMISTSLLFIRDGGVVDISNTLTHITALIPLIISLLTTVHSQRLREIGVDMAFAALSAAKSAECQAIATNTMNILTSKHATKIVAAAIDGAVETLKLIRSAPSALVLSQIQTIALTAADDFARRSRASAAASAGVTKVSTDSTSTPAASNETGANRSQRQRTAAWTCVSLYSDWLHDNSMIRASEARWIREQMLKDFVPVTVLYQTYAPTLSHFEQNYAAHRPLLSHVVAAVSEAVSICHQVFFHALVTLRLALPINRRSDTSTHDSVLLKALWTTSSHVLFIKRLREMMDNVSDNERLQDKNTT